MTPLASHEKGGIPPTCSSKWHKRAAKSGVGRHLVDTQKMEKRESPVSQRFPAFFGRHLVDITPRTIRRGIKVGRLGILKAKDHRHEKRKSEHTRILL